MTKSNWYNLDSKQKNSAVSVLWKKELDPADLLGDLKEHIFVLVLTKIMNFTTYYFYSHKFPYYGSKDFI